MTALFLDQFASTGGGQRSMLELLPMIRARGWNPRIALPGEGTFAGQLRACRFPVDFIRCGSYTPGHKRLADLVRFGREFQAMAAGISALVTDHKVGLLYVNGPRLLPAAALVARARSIPLVFHCHHRLLQPLAVRLIGTALRWARASMIGCCQFAVEPLRAYLGPERCRVIYNGVPVPSWRRRPRDPLKLWNIGAVGRIESEKGQLEFAAAARILSSELSNCRFIIAGAPLFSGPEYLEKVKAASRDLPLEFFGWQDDIGALFSQLDLLVVPSTDIDSTPRVVLEAFAGGLPVIAFPSGGIPEIVQDGKTGFLAAAATPAALAARIRSVLRMETARIREVADRAQALWSDRYTLERFQDEVCDVLARASS
jgi:glycosyltransferase involved in cell wall biosynthesis